MNDRITEADCEHEARFINDRFDTMNERREREAFLVNALNKARGLTLNRHQWETRYVSHVNLDLYIHRDGDDTFTGWMSNELRELT